MPLPVKSAMRTTWAGLCGLDGDGIGEAAAAQAGEHVERVRAGVDRHEVGRTAGRERSGGHARRRFQAGDLGRAAGIDRGQPGPGAIGDGRGEGAIAQVAEDAHLAGQLVGDHQVERAAPGGIDRLDVGDAQADGQGHRWQESRGIERTHGTDELDCNAAAEVDRKRAVAGIADDQVGQAVAVQVGRDDLRRELAGGERSAQPDETAVAVSVKRDGVVLGVDAGEDGALIGVRQPGDVAREGFEPSPGLTVTGGSKVPGWPGMPWR